MTLSRYHNDAVDVMKKYKAEAVVVLVIGGDKGTGAAEVIAARSYNQRGALSEMLRLLADAIDQSQMQDAAGIISLEVDDEGRPL